MSNKLKTDIIIFGGGIAGLWLLNILRGQGYHALLIEKNTLGGMQSLASQGMIHGGQKYTLTGKASDHALDIAQMPQIWDDCFKGQGEIDLSGVNFLSDHQLMWSTPSLISNIGVFAAAKAVNANTEKLNSDKIPNILQEISGQVYRLPECVMDAKALISALTLPHRNHIYQADITDIFLKDGEISSITLNDNTTVTAHKYIFTAGQGNEEISKALDIKERITQRRPLKQVMAKGLSDKIYGHCITASPKPRVTLTSHPIGMDKYVWYMGGNIAEKSVDKSDADAMAFAKSEMSDIFPNINWDSIEWAVWSGDRAEPYDEKGNLPPGSHFKTYGNAILGWPTKLTFAPALAKQILDKLNKSNYKTHIQTPKLPLKQAKIGQYPWETVQWTTLKS